MKNVKTEQFRIITGGTVEEYQNRLNAALVELRDKNPQVEFHQSNPMFAYIRYTLTDQIPEDLADEYKLMGIRFTCYDDCVHCWGQGDRRRTRYECEKEIKGLFPRMEPCCEEFYRRYARGDKSWMEVCQK